MTETTITEKARISIPLVLWLSGIGSISLAACAVWGSYVAVTGEIESIRKDLGSIEKNIEKLVDRVETGPSRREFDLLVERLRLVETKLRE